MRQLRPQVAEDRKRRLLQWVIHRSIKTSGPIASQEIADDAGLDLSSASIRGILKELEDEGFLHQPHTSAGRVPTDKGYRFYVDFLSDVQRLAAEEKEGIERQYARRTEELDQLLSETSKLLARASHAAGLVLSPKMEKQALKRLELLPMGGDQVLAVIVTQAGLIRHWPITLKAAPTPQRLARLNRFLNDHIQSKSLREAREAVSARIESAERELRDLGELAQGLLSEMAGIDPEGELYMDGASRILQKPEELGDFREIQSLIEMIESRRTLARLLEEEIEAEEKATERGGKSLVHVRIGRENRLPELQNLSLVTTTYRFGDRVVGVLGVLGSKRMEYSKMMAIVNHVSEVVSKALESWMPEGGKEP